MLKQLLMWTFICSTPPVVCVAEPGRSDSISCDTAAYAIPSRELDEVIVAVARTINKNDRKVIRPDRETINISSDGIDLLRRLQLARIAVNPLTQEVAASGGGRVVMCVNGVEATSAQISSIRPQDILRIEYHDNPGMRYDDATAVIDFIISRHDTGGSLSLDAFGAFASGRYASIGHFSGQYNRGPSVWNVNVGFMGQRKDRWIRDYEETWHYPDATLSRRETGLPVDVGGAGLESTVNYNYMHPRGNVLNLRLGLDFSDVPNMEEGDRHALLVTSDAERPVEVIEHTGQHSLRPNLDVYYLHRFDDTRNVTVEGVGSYMKSGMLHVYSEDGTGETTRVNGEKFSLKFRGMFERRAGSRVWNAGISYSSSFVSNTYCLDDMVEVGVLTSRTAVGGEFSDRFGKWGVVCSLRGAYDHLGQDECRIDRFFVLPAVNVTYRPADRWLFRYAASLDYAMPSPGEVSAVEQPVQIGMVRRGNPCLKPFGIISQAVDAGFERELIGVDARVEYRSEQNPLMESVIFENGRFVRTYYNQRSFRRIITGVSLTLRPWRNHLSITAEPVLTHYISRGIDYAHTHDIFRVGLAIDFNYGNWLAYGNIMSGPANKMYGEEIIEEKDMNQIMVGYKRSRWSLHAGVFNAFMRNYWMETRNLSALTPYTSKARSARSSSYFALKLTISLDFGRRGRDVDAPDYDTDDDSGILTITK